MQQLHRPIARRATAPGLGCVLALLALVGGVHADDTEVFFGQTGGSRETRPNVLFVLDTSGSMNWYENGKSTPDNAYQTRRIDRLKAAMHEILDDSSDINVGLMRFSGSYGGGAVIEPLTPIDDIVCRDALCDEISTFSQVSGTAGDAEETISNGNVSLNGWTLTMGATNNGSGASQVVGLSFDELDIPQGARIVDARIEFTADKSNAQPSSLTIRVEDAADAAPFAGTTRDVSGRPAIGLVPWTPRSWTVNSVYDSPDLADLVQLVTDKPEWCGRNALNVVIRGTGSRSAKSTRHNDQTAPKLKVTYDASDIPIGKGCTAVETSVDIASWADDVSQLFPSNGTVYTNLSQLRMPRYYDGAFYQMLTGLRFTGLDVPNGADIDEAYITLKAGSGSNSNSARVDIEVQDSDDAPSYPTGTWGVSNLPRIPGSTSWDLPVVNDDDTVRSPDIGSLIEDLVARPGWEPNNAVSLLLRPDGATGGRRHFDAYGSGTPASLHVRYRTLIGGLGQDRTARESLKQAVSNLQPQGGTPIVGALYEASRYMLGGPVDYGRTRGFQGDLFYDYGQKKESILPQPSGNWSNIGHYDRRSRLNRTSHPDSWTGGTLNSDCPRHDPSNPACRTESIGDSPVYTSPMVGTCQSHHVVLLSDGQPSGNGAAKRVEALTGASCFGDGNIAEQCGTELTDWMRNTDHNTSAFGQQSITTYTVGFDLQDNQSATNFLTGLSTAGGGSHFDASTTDELVQTFRDIIGEVRTVDTAFVSPGATVNQFNRLTHRNDIYFAVFKPAENVRWSGNLKRYKVVDEGDDIVIKDVRGENAVDPDTGFFAGSAQSFWSDSPDGSDVRRGGIANELERGSAGVPRRVFTDTSSPATSGTIDLTSSLHALSEDNDAITREMLGVDDEAYKKTLLRWARGIDVKDADGDGSTTDIRREIGDPMHSQPVILNYGDSPAENETTVFVATNQGFLHAIDPQVNGTEVPDASIDGAELFSWIPQALLGNLDDYYENDQSQEHRYGLDGLMSAWIDDRDGDLTVDSDEKAYLFLGMRRGGSDFYALDVSDRTSPKLAWTIRGGVDGSTDFSKLGQSWSRPVPARIQIDGQQKNVVIFTGGYDTNQDPTTTGLGTLLPRKTDSVGNGLYIVEMETGELVWSGLGTAGGTQRFDDMDYSMPASPAVIDVDLDGLTDQIWTSDAGGQVWRFDVTPYHRSKAEDGDFIRGGVMARLGSALPAEQRRFYYTPDVALIKHDGKRFATVSIGSGWRAHPLNKSIDDRFYVLRTPDVYERPEGYGRYDELTSRWVPITDADLANANDLSLDVDLEGHGWYKELDTIGEKVLSSSLTINGQVTFTTYMPDLQVEPCSPAIGTGAVYILDVVSGRPTTDLDKDGDVDENDDKRTLKHPGLPPPVVAIITENNEGGMVGPEALEIDFGQMTRRSFWTDMSDSPENADMADLADD